MKRIAIILGHPSVDSFCGALASAYAEGADSSGAAVRRIELAKLKFDPILHRGYKADQPGEPDLTRARETLAWSEHQTWIWPLWYGSAPALVKGFVERALIPGFAVEPLDRPPYFRPLLRGRSGRLIVTMQMPRLYYRLAAGSRATRTFRKQILEFVGISPVHEMLCCGVEDSTKAQREGWLQAAGALGAQDAR
jgi:NAD(P)H dehydrogenase (quinone)